MPQDSRRNFLGTAATAATALAGSQVLGANERLRFGIIGAGDRGLQLLREGLAVPQVEFVAAADVYPRRLEQAKALKGDIKTYLDPRSLLEDKSIDAVIIATPQHLHCEHFVAALDAGKHVYQEKTMAFEVSHAKRMREAYQRRGQTHGADWPPGDVVRADGRCGFALAPFADGQDHVDRDAHVPEFSPWQAAVDAAGAARHDGGEHSVEELSG